VLSVGSKVAVVEFTPFTRTTVGTAVSGSENEISKSVPTTAVLTTSGDTTSADAFGVTKVLVSVTTVFPLTATMLAVFTKYVDSAVNAAAVPEFVKITVFWSACSSAFHCAATAFEPNADVVSTV
jgi:hypothetical protein